MRETTVDNCLYPASSELAVTPGVPPIAVAAVPVQATNDAMLVNLWVHGRSPHTQRGYRAEIQRFLSFSGKPLRATCLIDLQRFSDHLGTTGLAPVSRNRAIAALKSLFSFGLRIGYMVFDTAKPMRLEPVMDTLSQRIMDEADVLRLIALEPNPRNLCLLTLAYASGCRVSELSSLRWCDCLRHHDGSGQITVLGKRGKTRAIRLPGKIISMLMGLRTDCADENSPVFVSRRRRALSPQQMLRIAKSAAKRAGIRRNVVLHSFRHANASHSLDHGAPIHLVQATLGHSDLSTTGKYLHVRPGESSANYLAL